MCSSSSQVFKNNIFVGVKSTPTKFLRVFLKLQDYKMKTPRKNRNKYVHIIHKQEFQRLRMSKNHILIFITIKTQEI